MNEMFGDIKGLNRSGRLLLFLLFSWLLSLLFPMNARIETNDPLGYYAQTVALAERASTDLSREAGQLDEFGWIHNLKKDPVTGKVYSQYPIGVSLMQLPFYFMGKAFEEPSGAGATWTGDRVWWVCAGSAFYGLAGLLFLLLLGRQLWGSVVSLLATIFIFLGTALFYYMFFQPGMSHSYAFFLSSSFLFAWLRPLIVDGRLSWERASSRSLYSSFLLGVLLGFCFIVRYLDGLLCLFLVFECILLLWIHSDRGVKKLLDMMTGYVGAFLGFVVIAGLQFCLQYLKHDSFNILNHYDGSFEQASSYWKWLQVLFSSHHGLFYWHPILGLGLIGLFWIVFKGRRNWRIFGLWVLTGLLVYALIVASWGRFSFGANSFGHRFFISLYPLFFVFMGVAIAEIRSSSVNLLKPFLLITAICLIMFNASAMLQFATGVIAPNEPVSWIEMIVNTWQELPQELERRFSY